MLTPYIYWNDRGDFKKEPRYCATGVNYGADWTVDASGTVRKNPKHRRYTYILGAEKPNYPVPAISYDCTYNRSIWGDYWALSQVLEKGVDWKHLRVLRTFFIGS